MRLSRYLLAAVVAAGLVVPAAAQKKKSAGPIDVKVENLPPENSAPEVILAQNGADNLLADLEFVLMLTSPEEQKQWKKLEDYLEVFLIGVDRKRPNRIDILLQDDAKDPEGKGADVAEVKATSQEQKANGRADKPPKDKDDKKVKLGGAGYRYRPSFPVADLKEFRRNNLEGVGIDTIQRARTLYQCKNAFVGWMRYLYGYAIFGEKHLGEKDSDVPNTLPDPSRLIAPLVARYDLAGIGKNTVTASEAIRERFDFAERQKKDRVGRLVRGENETEDAFAIRKLLYEHELDEIQRIYAEGDELFLGWNTDAGDRKGRLDLLRLSALPGTPLAETIENAGKDPSRFAAVPRSKGSVLSGRFNWPLDEMRQENLLELFRLLHSQEVARIDEDKTREKDEKQGARELSDRLLKFFETTVNAGLADGFVEVHANASGKHTAVGGFKAVDGHDLVEALELIPRARNGQKVEIDADKAGNVRIHRAVVDIKEHVHFQDFLGTDVVYVGTDKDAVWFASGENALDELKATIQRAGARDAKPADRFAVLFVKLLPWVELEEKRAGKAGKPELRRMAIEAFRAGDDVLEIEVSRTADNELVGGMLAGTGVLRFAGKLIADFTKENLED